MLRKVGPPGVAIVTGCLLLGCGSNGTPLASPTTTAGAGTSTSAPSTSTSPTSTSTPPYHPVINPANFTDQITNPLLPLKPGTTHTYHGTRDGVPTVTVVTVERYHKTVMGVVCLVISDIVTENNTLVEKTTDWYAQDRAGNVWYFGETTAEYQNGVVTTTAGTWAAGIDRALPGIVMPAHPTVGMMFRQEYRPSVALDQATILAVNVTIHVPAGTFHGAVITLDHNPLDPTLVEHKWYAPGVGFIHSVKKGGGHTEVSALVR
jgi:hypothetical protein